MAAMSAKNAQRGSSFVETTLALLCMVVMIAAFQRWSVSAIASFHRRQQVHLLALQIADLSPGQLEKVPETIFPPAWPDPVSRGSGDWMWIRDNESLHYQKNMFHLSVRYCKDTGQCATSSRNFFSF